MNPTTVHKTLLMRLCTMGALAILFLVTPFGSLFAKSTTWTHGSLTSDLWSDAANWNNGVPTSLDNVYFSAIGGTSTLDLPYLNLTKLDMTGYTGTLAAYGANIRTLGDFTTSGVCILDYAILYIGGDFDVTGTLHAVDVAITVLGSVSISGELHCPAGVLEVGGNVTGSPGAILSIVSGIVTLGGNGLFADFDTVALGDGGLLNLNAGSGLQTVAFGASGVTLHDVTINRSAATDVTQIQSPAALVFGRNVTITQGTLTLTPSDVTFNGTITVRGEFDYTVPGGTLRFAAGLAGMIDVTAGGILKVIGAPPDRIRLRQDGILGGNQWVLGHDGTSSITMNGVDVQDSDASGGPPVTATNSANKGNNTNWDFAGPKTTKWIAEFPTSFTWSDPLNWDLGSPESGDAVVFDSIGGPSEMDISGLTLASMNMSGYSGDLTMMYDLAIAGNLTTSGTLTLDGRLLAITGSLTVGGTMNAAGAAVVIGGSLNLYGTCNWTPGATVDVTGDVTAVSSALLLMNDSILRIGGHMQLAEPGAMDMCNIHHLICGGVMPDQVVSFPQIPGALFLGFITLERPAGAVTQFYRFGMTIALDGELSVTSGVFELVDASLSVTGTTTIGAEGRLEVTSEAGSMASFIGPVNVRGALSYQRPGGTISFAAGSPGAIDAMDGGVFEIVGSLANRVHVEQDGAIGGDRWTLVHDGTTTINVAYVEMQDGDAQGPRLAAAANSIDEGNNVNWYFGTVSGNEAPPLRLSLEAAPNPFNPTTTLRYGLPGTGNATIRIYDAAGRLVRTIVAGHHAAGRYQAHWDGRNDSGLRAGSGMYFCRLESNAAAAVQKLVLLQ